MSLALDNFAVSKLAVAVKMRWLGEYQINNKISLSIPKPNC